jgi:hypothetical protein
MSYFLDIVSMEKKSEVNFFLFLIEAKFLRIRNENITVWSDAENCFRC